jgi:hypothetical protein
LNNTPIDLINAQKKAAGSDMINNSCPADADFHRTSLMVLSFRIKAIGGNRLRLPYPAERRSAISDMGKLCGWEKKRREIAPIE